MNGAGGDFGCGHGGTLLLPKERIRNLLRAVDWAQEGDGWPPENRQAQGARVWFRFCGSHEALCVKRIDEETHRVSVPRPRPIRGSTTGRSP